MNRRGWIAIVTVAVIAAGAGWLSARWANPSGPASTEAPADGPCPGGAAAVYWKAPMDPTYVRDEPGKSPMGMDLVPVCPGADGAQGEEGVVRISPTVVQNMGVKTAPVERRKLSRRIRTLGRVAYDERLVNHVHTKVQGWVEKLHVEYEGQMVRKGEPLLEVYSPELVSTQEEFLLAARYQKQTGESRFDDVSEGGRALFEATRRRLELFDIPERDIQALLRTGRVRKTLTLYAPSSGVVTHLMVRGGMEVGSNDNLYTIADLSRVWIYADIYEYELPWIEEGQRGTADLSYLPGQSFEGEVTYVYPFLDPKTRTARVRLEFENPELVFKPDMYANVTIEAEPRANVKVVPDEAVIRSGRQTLVIVAAGEGRFEPRPVQLGLDSGDGWVEITDGLDVGERVVTSGQFLIDSESKLEEAVQKLLAPVPAHDAPMEAPGVPEGEPGAEHAEPSMPADPNPHAGHSMSTPAGDEGNAGTRKEHSGHRDPPSGDPGS